MDTPSRDLVQQLVNNDIPRAIAERALIVTRNNLDEAAYLIASKDPRVFAPAAQRPQQGTNTGGLLNPAVLSDVLSNIHVSGNQGISRDHEVMDLTGAAGDEDLKEAMKRSMATTSQPSTGGRIDEDEAMQLAIASSIKDAQGDPLAFTTVSTNPHYRKREDQIMVGLKNVGNTCYFNSLLQTYFCIPEVRAAVLSYPPNLQPKDDKDPNKDYILFMRELQRLFAQLILSNQKYVDPSPLLKKVLKDGKPVDIGEQEDVAEFNELFLRMLQQGVSIAWNDKSDYINKMFYGNGVNSFVYHEQDGTAAETLKEHAFSSIIVPIPNEQTDLYSCIDKGLCDELDEYTTDKGFKTKASSVQWLKHLPAVLMFRENRVQYDREKKSNVKRETPITIEREIYMDRYLIENKEETTKRRLVVAEWRAKLAALEAELRSYTHYKEGNHGLDQALQSVITFYSEKNTNNVYATILNHLHEDHTRISAIIANLKEQVNELKGKINAAYDDMKGRKFTLFGAWIHQGFAGGGHYWAYLKNYHTDKWIKFNDIRISQVEEELVLREAIGGSANTSGYFLIYVDERALTGKHLSPEVIQNSIPEKVLLEVKQENEKFIKELAEYDEKHADKHEIFYRKYQDRIQEVEKLNPKDFEALETDPRLHNYYAFLSKVGVTDIMMAEIFRNTYEEVFKNGLEKDVGTGTLQKIEEKLGKEISVLATKIAFDKNEVRPYADQYSIFCDVANLQVQGMEAMLANKPQDAIRYYAAAVVKDRTLQHISVRRESEILVDLVVCLHQLFDRAIAAFSDNSFYDAHRLFSLAIVTAHNTLPHNSKVFKTFKENFLIVSETARAILEPQEEMQIARLHNILLNPGASRLEFPFDLPLPKRPEKSQAEAWMKKLDDTIKDYKKAQEKAIADATQILNDKTMGG